MTNLVTVTATVVGAPGEVPEGNYEFVPTGTRYDSATGVVVSPEVQQGQFSGGSISVPILASDNWAAGVLTWDITVDVRGLNRASLTGVLINYVSGASQNLWSILTANGWVPVAS